MSDYERARRSRGSVSEIDLYAGLFFGAGRHLNDERLQAALDEVLKGTGLLAEVINKGDPGCWSVQITHNKVRPDLFNLLVGYYHKEEGGEIAYTVEGKDDPAALTVYNVIKIFENPAVEAVEKNEAEGTEFFQGKVLKAESVHDLRELKDRLEQFSELINLIVDSDPKQLETIEASYISRREWDRDQRAAFSASLEKGGLSQVARDLGNPIEVLNYILRREPRNDCQEQSFFKTL